jgi:hypothetical protein
MSRVWEQFDRDLEPMREVDRILDAIEKQMPHIRETRDKIEDACSYLDGGTLADARAELREAQWCAFRLMSLIVSGVYRLLRHL